jgi:hypothetical protein
MNSVESVDRQNLSVFESESTDALMIRDPEPAS